MRWGPRPYLSCRTKPARLPRHDRPGQLDTLVGVHLVEALIVDPSTLATGALPVGGPIHDFPNLSRFLTIVSTHDYARGRESPLLLGGLNSGKGGRTGNSKGRRTAAIAVVVGRGGAQPATHPLCHCAPNDVLDSSGLSCCSSNGVRQGPSRGKGTAKLAHREALLVCDRP
jgi:hypothetical protein